MLKWLHYSVRVLCRYAKQGSMVGWLGFNRTFSTKLLKWSGGAGCPFPKNPIPTKAIRSSVLGPLSFVIACLPKSLYQNTPVSKVWNILHLRHRHILVKRFGEASYGKAWRAKDWSHNGRGEDSWEGGQPAPSPPLFCTFAIVLNIPLKPNHPTIDPCFA